MWGNDMIRLLTTTAVIATMVAASAPALAVTASPQASATAKILRPLTLEAKQNLDFGTIVLSGTAFANQVVSISQTGVVSCGTTPGLMTCIGAPQAAVYKLTGTNNAIVKITCPAFSMGTLNFTPNFPATVDLGATGNNGTNFSIGGSIAISSTTPDGVYTGQFNVTADYQ
jgi:hypothetical protein